MEKDRQESDGQERDGQVIEYQRLNKMRSVKFDRRKTRKTMNIKSLHITALLIIMAFMGISCKQSECCGHFTEAEKALIHGTDSIMRVLTIEDGKDHDILRSACTDFSAEALRTDDLERLSELMIATVTHPSQDGVGIAGPQVGLNRRIIAVQRFDKEAGESGHPFEIYPNIRLVWASDSKEMGAEGCLSVPDRSGNVLRSTEITIEYADIKKLKEGNNDEIPMIRETISGFTAVIFQHEIDHLDGILYIDRL